MLRVEECKHHTLFRSRPETQRRFWIVARINTLNLSMMTLYGQDWHCYVRASTINAAFYDRGSTFRLFVFSECWGSLTRNRRNVNLVSTNGVFVYLGHGIVHRDAIRFFAGVSFRVRYGAHRVRNLRNFRVNHHRRTPPIDVDLGQNARTVVALL